MTFESEALWAVFRRAGLMPVETNVNAADVVLPYFEKGAEALKPLFQSHEASSPHTLIYFWDTQCDNCKNTVMQLDVLNQKLVFPNVKILFVVSESESPSTIENWKKESGQKSGIYWDQFGGWSEQLSILGSPGVLVVGPQRNVLARLNGHIETEHPAFDVMMTRLNSFGNSEQQKNAHLGFSSSSNPYSDPTTAGQAQMFGVSTEFLLSGIIFSFFLLFSIFFVFKFVKKTRANISHVN